MQFEFWASEPSHKNTLLDPMLVTEADRDYWLEKVVNTLDLLPHHDWITMQPPIEHGLYFQYEDRKAIYVGKSSGIRPTPRCSIAGRLFTHRDKCWGRWDIFPERMTYKVIPVSTKLEGHILLLENYAIQYFAPKWNGTGYGSAPAVGGRSGQGLSDFEKAHPLLGTPAAKEKERERMSSLGLLVD